jgi:preprotein translocase subunit YajC
MRDQGSLIPLVLGVVVLFHVHVRAREKKQEQQKNDLLEAVESPDKVQTIGGIIGTVVEARDNEVVLKVDGDDEHEDAVHPQRHPTACWAKRRRTTK